MYSNKIQPLLAQLADGGNLSYDDAVRAFQIIMNGGATPAQIGAFLIALRQKGETVEEITAGAMAIRAKAHHFNAPANAMDTCGTGGDGTGSLNISTAVAIVLAACGVPVVKHGNRAVSSSSGSADVLAELGVKIDAEPEIMQQALAESNLCFLMAPLYHKAMRHVAPVRQELAMRTVFNLLGPLSNPSGLRHQLIGVYAREWVEPLAQVAQKLGMERVWVVHGHSGEDELSLTGPSYVAELKNGNITTFTISPEDAGLGPSPLEGLKGGDVRYNAERLRKLLTGENSPYRDAVLYNTAAALIIAGKVNDLRAGATLALEAIHEGKALKTLHQFSSATHASEKTA